MPSLNELREFKASFNNIGGEKANLKAKNIPFDDLELPDSEPDPTALIQPQSADEPLIENDEAQDTAEQVDAETQDAEIPNAQAEADTEQADVSPLDTFDFSAFLGGQPEDLPDPPSAADIDTETTDAPAPDTEVSTDAGTGDAEAPVAPEAVVPADVDTEKQYYPPEELLSNLSEELDAAPKDEDIPPPDEKADSIPTEPVPEEPSPANDAMPPDLPADPIPVDSAETPELPAEAPAADDDSLNLDDLGGLDIPAAEAPAAGGDKPTLDDLGDLDIPAAEAPAASGDNLNLDDLGGLDTPTTEAPAASDDNLNLDNLGDLDIPAAETPVAGDDNLNLDDLGGLDTPAAEAPVASDDNLNLDNLGDLDIPAAETPAAGDDNLTLDDLSDLGTSATGAPAAGDDNLNLDDLGGLDTPATEAPVAGDDNLTLDDLSDLGTSDTQTPAASDDNLNLDDLSDLNNPVAEKPAASDDNLNLDDLGGLDAPATEASAADDDNFNLDDLGGFDLGSEPIPENVPASGGDNPPAAEDDSINFDALDNFDLGEDSATADNGEKFDFSGLDNFDIPEESADTGETTTPTTPVESEQTPTTGDENLDLDIPAAEAPVAADDNLDLGELGDLDTPATEAPAADDDKFDLDDLGGFDLGSEPTPEDGSSENLNSSDDLDLDNLDGFDLHDGQTPDAGDLDLDNLGGFDLGDDSGTEGDNSSDEFSLPDLTDDVLNRSQKTIIDEKPKPKAKRQTKDKKTAAAFTPAENVDEIQLNEEELESLQKTLSNYPLNLRVACEEIIAEHVVEPEKLSKLIMCLVQGETAKETALLAGHILGKMITIPKGFEKSSGEALEAERASFAYIFVHNFLPVLRIFAFIAAIVGSVFYLTYRFIYIPNKAESIYKIGYERIYAGEYQRANERFTEAFNIYRKKNWFYKYAEAFRDERQYIYAEQKYDELLRYYPRDKKGVLDYAHLETYYLRNYAKADNLLRRQILDYAPNDYDGWLALGDNSLMWGEIDPSKYEDARYAYARLLDKYGWTAPVAERMLKYFIRTDDLKEVLYVKQWFDASTKRNLSAESLAELGGYLLDKQLEEVKGVPNAYIEYISGVRDLLLQAVQLDPSLPEPHYHLARYYHNLGGVAEERTTLEHAIYAFDHANEESVRRLIYRIDAHQRYADLLINDREFFPAQEQLVKGKNLYENAILRRLMTPSPQYGKLYAGLGDLEYFTKTGNMRAALGYYHDSEKNGWAPPEMQYRMGSAYYQLEDWKNALEYFFNASSSLPLNRRILFAMGNAALKRGDYFAAHAYYNRLLDILENQRVRLPILLPNDRPEYLELAERLMMARNNAGVACEMLANQTGDRSYQTRALAFYAEAERAWDARSRDPSTLIRSNSTPLPYLNSRNALYPVESYEPQIFIRIDREASESSPWEKLVPLAWVEAGRD